MKSFLFASILALGSLQCSCASKSPDTDSLCREIARFANATPFNTPRIVRLTTDWGGVFTSSDVMAEKACQHGADKAGKSLCAYLMKNTSTEFASINYRRALTCIGQESAGQSPADDDSLPPSALSSVVNGKPVRSRVTVKFTRGTQGTPPELSISTGAN